MPYAKITPGAVAVLRRASELHGPARIADPQAPDPHVAVARAAEALHAPARAELAASRALEACLGADDAYGAVTAARDAEMRRRLDLDAWLQDWRDRR